MDLVVCVAEARLPGMGMLWPDVYFGIHLRRKETIETSKQPVPGIEQRQHGYARLHAKRRLR